MVEMRAPKSEAKASYRFRKCSSNGQFYGLFDKKEAE